MSECDPQEVYNFETNEEQQASEDAAFEELEHTLARVGCFRETYAG